MYTKRKLTVLLSAVALLAPGCAMSKVDFSEIERPGRAPQLEKYDVFVGSWIWEAEVLNAEGPDKTWAGTAEWHWTLDNRCLHGTMASKSANAEFESSGVWSWHPKKKKYIWWMFNNWGYPQQGTASYNDATETWRMPYKSVGLDGSTSYGRYEMIVQDENTLTWCMKEWADPLHTIKKIEMRGTYKRQ